MEVPPEAALFANRSPETAFRELDHPADLFLEIRGDTIGGLYENGLYGYYYAVTELPSVRPEETRRFVIRAADVAEGLRRTIAEAVFLFDTEGFLGAAALVEIALTGPGAPDEARRVEADVRLWGERLDPGRHEVLTDIKAVTRHRLDAHRDPARGWTATVILDV